MLLPVAAVAAAAEVALRRGGTVYVEAVRAAVTVSGERVSTSTGGFNPTWQRHVAAYAAAARLLPPGRVLDLGCGVGHCFELLAPRETVGVDIAEDALAGQDRPTIVADMRAVPVESASFDSVLSVQSIEHVPDPERIVAEARRVLAPGGTAMFVTPNRLTFARPDEIIDPYHHVEFDADAAAGAVPDRLRRRRGPGPVRLGALPGHRRPRAGAARLAARGATRCACGGSCRAGCASWPTTGCCGGRAPTGRPDEAGHRGVRLRAPGPAARRGARPGGDLPVSTRAAHYPLMDSMRGIAVIAVVATHTSFFTALQGGDTTQVRFGFISVTVFFILSAFLLYGPFVDARLADREGPAVLGFAWRRVLRVVPAYYVALTADRARPRPLLRVHARGRRSTSTASPRCTAPSWVLRGLPQAWTLCVEVVFYALLPVWAVLMRRLRAASREQRVRQELWGCAALFAASFVYKLVINVTGAIDGALGRGRSSSTSSRSWTTSRSAWRSPRWRPPTGAAASSRGAIRVLDRFPSIAWAVGRRGAAHRAPSRWACWARSATCARRARPTCCATT